MITSTGNPKVKYVRRLLASRRHRQREQAYVVEGTRWLAELDKMGIEPHLFMAGENWIRSAENENFLQRFSAPVHVVSDRVMLFASDTESPPGILAVVSIRPRPLPSNPTLLIILDRVVNPGNMGSVLRTTAAAGGDGIILGPGCVDPYNPKVVRGGMGAHLRVPVRQTNWTDIKALTSGLDAWVAAPKGGHRYYDVDWRRPSALIIGGEAHGAGRSAWRLTGKSVSIPMQAETESLNASVAAGIILFEAVRQRATSS